MSGDEFAGRLRERVTVSRPEARDALGGGQSWTLVGMAWASVRPEGRGPEHAGEARAALPVWRVTMRPCDIAVGDRIGRVDRALTVREVRDDPALPDRITVIAEEER